MKKIIAFILCFVLVLSAVGCGTNTETNYDTQNEFAEDTSADTSIDTETAHETVEEIETAIIEADTEIDTSESESDSTEISTDTDTAVVTIKESETATETVTEAVTEREPVTEKETEIVTEAETESEVTSASTTEAETTQIETSSVEVQPIESEEAVVTDTTEAETSEVVQEPIEPTVTDAVTYTKRVIEYFGDNKGSFTDAYPPHSIVLPAISGDSETVSAINKKIIDAHSEKIETVKNNEEENLVYNIDYEYFKDNGILTILLSVDTGHQASYRYSEYFAYYYDYINDKELSLDEYMAVIGCKKTDYLDIVSDTIGMGYVATEDNIGPVVSDNGKIIIIYEGPFGWNKLEI